MRFAEDDTRLLQIPEWVRWGRGGRGGIDGVWRGGGDENKITGGTQKVSVFVSVCLSVSVYRLVGLVVKASASRAEGPGFESRLRRDFFGVKSYQ